MTEPPADAEPRLPPLPPLPPHPLLRPGVQVVRRDDRHLQVGLDLPDRVLVRDDPGVRPVLTALLDARPPAPSSMAGVELLDRLVAAGLVVDGAPLVDRAPGERVGPVATAALASLVARSGAPGVEQRLARRRAARVGLAVPQELVEPSGALLVAGGCPRPLESAALAEASPSQPGGQALTVALVVTDGEAHRGRLDRFVRADVPHLVVGFEAFGMRIGPFVVPGATACVRCIDAHRATGDPGRLAVVEQLGRGQHLFEGRFPTPPRDPLLASVALGYAVSQLLAYIDGEQPLTWSATLDWAGNELPGLTRWQRHPHCGCAWGEALVG